jgi:hypothetical protein
MYAFIHNVNASHFALAVMCYLMFTLLAVGEYRVLQLKANWMMDFLYYPSPYFYLKYVSETVLCQCPQVKSLDSWMRHIDFRRWHWGAKIWSDGRSAGKINFSPKCIRRNPKLCWKEVKPLQIQLKTAYRKYKDRTHMSLVAHPSSQPSWAVGTALPSDFPRWKGKLQIYNSTQFRFAFLIYSCLIYGIDLLAVASSLVCRKFSTTWYVILCICWIYTYV